AVYSKLSNAFHAYCVWHIEKNVNTKFRTKLDGKIWAAAKALHIEGFAEIMEEIFNMHAEAAAYLNEIPSAIVNALYFNRYTTYSSVQAMLPQTITQQLQSVIDSCRKRMVYQASDSVFEVKSND
ncbi:14145_t:CDS:2, partial [Ambispora leptoticha]